MTAQLNFRNENNRKAGQNQKNSYRGNMMRNKLMMTLALAFIVGSWVNSATANERLDDQANN